MNLKKVIQYFDPNARPPTASAEAATTDSGGGKASLLWWPQYVVLALGVFLEPYLAHYQAQGTWQFEGGIGRAFFSVIIAFLIFPNVFRQLASEPKPWPILLAPIFAAGLGYQTLMASAIKAIVP